MPSILEILPINPLFYSLLQLRYYSSIIAFIIFILWMTISFYSQFISKKPLDKKIGKFFAIATILFVIIAFLAMFASLFIEQNSF